MLGFRAEQGGEENEEGVPKASPYEELGFWPIWAGSEAATNPEVGWWSVA